MTEPHNTSSYPPVLPHISAYVLVAVIGGWSLSCMGFQSFQYYLYVTMLLFGASSFILAPQSQVLRYVAHGMTAVCIAGTIFIGLRSGNHPLHIVELVLLMALISQTVGASDSRHYSMIALLAVLMIIMNIRNVGLLPTHFAVTSIVAGSALLADLHTDPEKSNRNRAISLSALPLPVFLTRVVLASAIGLIGGRYIAQHLPLPIQDKQNQSENLWLNYARNYFSAAEQRDNTRMPGSLPTSDRQLYNRHYATAAVLDLRHTDAGSLRDTILFTIDSQKPYYLKGLVLDEYTGKGWVISDNLRFQRVSRLGFSQTIANLPQKSHVEYGNLSTVTLRAHTHVGRIIYAPLDTSSIISDDLKSVLRDPLWNIYSTSPIRTGTTYTCQLTPLKQSESRSKPIRQMNNKEEKRYLQLPVVSNTLIQKCNDAIGDNSSRLRRVQQLTQLIKNGKQYTAAPQSIPSDSDAVSYFIGHMDEGSCSHFASALAVACRIVGIPARVVTGFARGTFDRTSMRWTIREEDSHAWTQVWFPQRGWVNFDPTPGRFQRTQDATTPDRTNASEFYQNFIQKAKTFINSVQQHSTRLWKQLNKHTLYYSMLGMGLLACLPLLYFFHRLAVKLLWWGRWHLARWLNPDSAARLVYRCTLQWLQKEGIDVAPSMTPSEVVALIQKEDVPWDDTFKDLSYLAQKIIFGTEEASGEDLEDLRGLALDVKKQLRSS